jgi:hypothetical protein
MPLTTSDVLKKVTEHHSGWFFSDNIGLSQKVNDRVFVYIQPLINGFSLQLYLRGQRGGFCTLEVRNDERNLDSLWGLFELGEIWLQEYKSGDITLLEKSRYHIGNPKGIWFDGSNGWQTYDQLKLTRNKQYA